MPYLILTSQAKLVNTYVCGPIVVGDKNADPKLMRAIGAKLVTNYPACGSPPLHLVYGHPRGVLEKLEELGFTLIDTSVAGDCRECILWTVHSPAGFADPNSKGSQTNEDEDKGSISSSQRSSLKERRSSAKKSTSSARPSLEKNNFEEEQENEEIAEEQAPEPS
ncbi:hypothetical protein LSTR_LSTR004776 [Laodelphax striatellus]|uniref:Uncharacterized protein n=1 Tax=Laodelphax striatellus TaxID=195883 RepID=A0A482XJQ3_LAOST|nr:hypothetical protein LSTR_LSTR004776 [Laodelphax striatellus]